MKSGALCETACTHHWIEQTTEVYLFTDKIWRTIPVYLKRVEPTCHITIPLLRTSIEYFHLWKCAACGAFSWVKWEPWITSGGIGITLENSVYFDSKNRAEHARRKELKYNATAIPINTISN